MSDRGHTDRWTGSRRPGTIGRVDARSLRDEVERFVVRPRPADFGSVALRCWRLQVERIPALAALERRSAIGGPPADWREIPAVPVQAFKTVRLAIAPAAETFRSSGTLGVRSEHHHPFPDLYRTVIDASFPVWCPLPPRTPILALVPPRSIVSDSSLGFMADHVVRTRGGPESAWAWTDDGLAAELATDWTDARVREGRPALIFATAFALVEWIDGLEKPLRLPEGSAILETGGLKGRVREIARPDLLERIEDRLGVPPSRVLREYGMCELTSQLYSRSLLGGDPDLLEGPPWVRVRVFDPRSLREAPPGEAGLVGILDLGNVGSAVHVLTQDLGRLESGSLRLLGRAAGSELRGCSLLVEETLG